MQEEYFHQIIATKLANRKLDTSLQTPTSNYVFLCEHPHVYTMGKRGTSAHLLASEAKLQAQGVACYVTDRGGDITYHGPGQLVVYFILDLENFFTDLHHYLRLLEEAVILTLQDFGLLGVRIPGLTGVWLNIKDIPEAYKVCAMGIKMSRWVTMHGLALNVNTDLRFFDQIIPCGIRDKKATSMAMALGAQQDLQTIGQTLLRHVARLFGMELA